MGKSRTSPLSKTSSGLLSGGVSDVLMNQSKGLNESKISELEKKGFVRWTKGDKDRLYIKGYQLDGVTTNWKKNGKKTVSVDGEELSYTKSAIFGSYGSSNYIDVKTGNISVSTDDGHYHDVIVNKIKKMMK